MWGDVRWRCIRRERWNRDDNKILVVERINRIDQLGTCGQFLRFSLHNTALKQAARQDTRNSS